MISAMRWGRSMAVTAAVALSLSGAACGNGEEGEFKPAQKKFTSGAASSPGGIEVSSSAFQNGGMIPERYSCKGLNQSPPLAWKGVPTEAASLAVVVTDPDAPNGVFVHWIVTGLPETPSGSLSAGSVPRSAKVEVNSAEQAGYTGMCPPAGQQHRYLFEVLALSRNVTFPAGAGPLDKVKALRAAAVKTGKLNGEFKG